MGEDMNIRRFTQRELSEQEGLPRPESALCVVFEIGLTELELDIIGDALYGKIHHRDKVKPLNPVRITIADEMMEKIEGADPLTVRRARKIVEEHFKDLKYPDSGQ